jgi:hypothetical protein
VDRDEDETQYDDNKEEEGLRPWREEGRREENRNPNTRMMSTAIQGLYSYRTGG